MPNPHPGSVLPRLERYYDAVPRRSARAEAIGPFTLFVAEDGGTFYARPRLGLSTSIDAADVMAVRSRQRSLGVPEAIEWVAETTPSLAGAARAAGLAVADFPLLVLESAIDGAIPAGVRVRRVAPDDVDLGRILAVADVGFAYGGTAKGDAGPRERDELAARSADHLPCFRERLATGGVVLVVAEDAEGPIACGRHQPVGDVTEIVAVATLPSARRRGIGAAVTGALVADALDAGVAVVFLSAESDGVARIYERLGFGRVAHAGVAEAPGG